MFPFKGKYSPPVNESEAKRPRTDGQTSATEHQATSKIKPTVALPSPYGPNFCNPRFRGNQKVYPTTYRIFGVFPLACWSMWSFDVCLKIVQRLEQTKFRCKKLQVVHPIKRFVLWQGGRVGRQQMRVGKWVRVGRQERRVGGRDGGFRMH
jgi:hypothetical protein